VWLSVCNDQKMNLHRPHTAIVITGPSGRHDDIVLFDVRRMDIPVRPHLIDQPPARPPIALRLISPGHRRGGACASWLVVVLSVTIIPRRFFVGRSTNRQSRSRGHPPSQRYATVTGRLYWPVPRCVVCVFAVNRWG